MGIGRSLRKASYALLAFFGLGEPGKVPGFRERKPNPIPTAPTPAPARKRSRPRITPERVTAWRKGRSAEADAVKDLRRAVRLTRRAARPSIKRSAEFMAKADRLSARVKIREGRLTSEGLVAADRLIRAA